MGLLVNASNNLRFPDLWTLVLLSPPLSAYAEPKYEELMAAISRSDSQGVHQVLVAEESARERTLNLNAIRADGWSPLCLASALGAPDIVGDLLAHGANPIQEVQIGNLKATPFILALQRNRVGVVDTLLAAPQFTESHRKAELNSLVIQFKQQEIARQVVQLPGFKIQAVESSLSSDASSSSASCSQAPKDPLDAQHLVDEVAEIECSICLDTPDRLSIAAECGHCFCEKCITPHMTSDRSNKDKCPNCRAQLDRKKFITFPFHWLETRAGSQKVPLPGEAIAQVHAAAPQVNRAPVIAARPPALAQQPLPVQNQAPIQEFVQVPNRLENLHKVFRIEADPNAVWTEPLRVVHQPGWWDRRRGRGLTLTDNLDEMDYNDLMRKDRGCFALNPPHQRDAIWQEVHQERAPSRGCYPPLKADFEKFREARGWRPNNPQGYRSPVNIPNMNRWFRSALPLSANVAYDFNGGDGDISGVIRGSRKAVVCRCVGAAW